MRMSAVLVEEGPDKGAIWHFGQPALEQRALAEGRAWADLSHLAVIAVSGVDRLQWLHDLTTQHLLNLASGQWAPALILDPNGHVEYQFNCFDDATSTWLIVDNDYAAGLVAYLNKMKFMLRVEVRDASTEFGVLRAPGASTDIGGPFILVPRADIEKVSAEFSKTSEQVGTWALEAERVAAHRPRHGVDTDFKAIPNELGLLNSSVHMNKGCYRGQETVAKIFHLGAPPRRLVMLHLDGSAVVMPEPGTPVMNGEVQVGYLGTLARHHELGPIALALIKRNTPIDATLTVDGITASQEIIVSGSR
jgi:folate-binding protein YgfZ